MPFFARPDLSNEQFKQLTGSTLTLEGQTQIATTSGLTLTDGSGGYIPIHATGGTPFDVLTYKDGVIKLEPSTASGATGIYDGASPSTCTVGGLVSGSPISGCSVNCILEEILVPTLDPALTNPSLSSFSINPSSLLYEVGDVIDVTGTTAFNAGCINPQYTATCDKRSDGVSAYTYSNFGVDTCVVSSLPSNVYSFGSHLMTAGNNTISSTIAYSGGTQPKDSAGGDYDSPLSAGNTNTSTKTICGVYPWFWGIESSGGAAAGVNRPTSDCIQSIITGCTYNCKCVGYSTGTLFVNFGSTSDDYLWFAVPNASTIKTKWYETALNNGTIGGAVSAGGNLFPDYDTETDVCSATPSWSGQSYNIYISNYQTASATIMELRNS